MNDPCQPYRRRILQMALSSGMVGYIIWDPILCQIGITQKLPEQRWELDRVPLREGPLTPKGFTAALRDPQLTEVFLDDAVQVSEGL